MVNPIGNHPINHLFGSFYILPTGLPHILSSQTDAPISAGRSCARHCARRSATARAVSPKWSDKVRSAPDTAEIPNESQGSDHRQLHIRRKFRSQTSDNMDRWKSRGGKNQRREEKRSKEERISKKRKSQKKEDAGARKGRKVASEGQRVDKHFWLQRVDK